MINEQLYKERDDEEIDEVFTEPPVNKTLFIIQLTDDEPIRPEVENLSNLADVFNHYKPSFDFEFMNADESTVTEAIHFTSLEDFLPENIIKRSICLNELQLLSSQLMEMNKGFSTNSKLPDIFLKTTNKKDFTGILKVLINDLEKEEF